MKLFIKKYYILFIEFLIFLFGIILTLLIEGKFDSYIAYAKEHPINSICIVSAVLIILVAIKILYEYNRIKKEENLSLLKEENVFLSGLISNFKYQISQPLEDELCKAFRKLKLDNNYRITVYTYTYDRFFSIGRYSENPNYKKFGRIAIRDKKELIFKAWYGNELTEKVTPDQKLNMKSKKISIKFLYEKNSEHPRKDRFGLIVFETTKNKESKLELVNLEEATELIQTYFDNKWNIRQNLTFAMREGL